MAPLSAILMASCVLSLASGALASSDRTVTFLGRSFELPFDVPGRQASNSILPWDSWSIDALFFSLAVTFVINILLGRRANTQIAQAWAEQLCAPEGVLQRNFSKVGPTDAAEGVDGSDLVRMSGSEFVIPASGRKNVLRFEAALFLRKRQDVVTYLLSTFFSSKDEVEFRVILPEDSIPPSTMVLGHAKVIKMLAQQEDDIKAYAKTIALDASKLPGMPRGAVGKPGVGGIPRPNTVASSAAGVAPAYPGFPAPRLSAAAEAPALLYEVFQRAIVATAAANGASGSTVNSPEAVWTLLRPFLRYAHLTDAFPRGQDRNVILVVLKLPADPRNAREALLTGARLSLALADALTEAKLSPDATKRALAARRAEPVAASKEAAEARRQSLEEQREKKARLERERLARLPPAQRQKELERKEAIERKRSMKKMVKKG